MYIWMVIAAFISMLYSFTLSYRADMRTVAVAPRAESTIDKIVLQHRALEKYADDHIFYTSGSRNVTFDQGEVPFNDLVPYLPYGFNSGKDESDYVSSVYCMDRESASFSMPLECTNYKAAAYLITYGCIDQRWRSLSGGKPNNDLVMAINKIVRSGTNFGYTVEADINDERNEHMKSTMAIQGSLNTWVAIPQYIIDSDNGIVDKSFRSICVENSNCEYCLVYMTPFY